MSFVVFDSKNDQTRMKGPQLCNSASYLTIFKIVLTTEDALRTRNLLKGPNKGRKFNKS